MGKEEGEVFHWTNFNIQCSFNCLLYWSFPGLVWYLPGIFAQGIMMEHLACPWLCPKRSQNRSFLSFLFVLPLALQLPLLPNWLSDRFSELAIGKLTRSSRKRQESKCGAICWEDWEQFAREKDGERVKKCEKLKKLRPILCRACLERAEPLASAYWRTVKLLEGGGRGHRGQGGQGGHRGWHHHQQPKGPGGIGCYGSNWRKMFQGHWDGPRRGPPRTNLVRATPLCQGSWANCNCNKWFSLAALLTLLLYC